MKQGGLRFRILLAALLPVVLVVAVLTTIFGIHQTRSLENAMESRGRAEARQLAKAAELGIFSGNHELLSRLVRNMSQGDADITAASIMDTHGNTLARSGISSLLQKPASAAGERIILTESTLVVIVPIRSELLEIEDIYSGRGETSLPQQDEALVILELSRAALRAEQWRLLLLGAVASLCGLLLGGLLATRIARGVTRPVLRLGEVVRRIANGDLVARAAHDSAGTVRQLEDGINEMAERIASAQNNLESRITVATAELRQRKDEAERTTMAMKRFLTAASHDLRQPMHALGLFVSRLSRLPLSHEAHGVVRHIEAAVSAQQDLLDTLLDVSRIDAGLVVPRLGMLSVTELFNHVAIQLGEQARQKRLTFRQRGGHGLNLRTDSGLITRILVNLVSNAIRYTQRGGVLLACRRRGDVARIEVWDTGIGIAPEMSQTIFEEYVQLDNPERDRAKGLGLGLAICARLAHLLSLQIQMRSIPGRGSVFWIDVPIMPNKAVKEVAEAAATLAAMSAQEETLGALKGTVVIVEDDPLVLASTVELIESWGCRVIAGNTVADVLADCVRSHPDVAIFDYLLAGNENGISSAKAVRQRCGDIPVLLVSGNIDDEMKRNAVENGFTMLLSKPLKPARLRAILAHLLSTAQSS